MKMAITGHRPDKLNNDYELKSPLVLAIKSRLLEVIELYEPTMLISGMALGIDTLWAQIAVENNIPLIAYIPFVGQEKLWLPESIVEYCRLLNKAHEIKYICSPGYAPEKMQIRNEAMVKDCDILVAVWDGSTGGTGNCVKYAKKRRKSIVEVNPNDFRK